MQKAPRTMPLAVCLILGAVALVGATSLAGAAVAHRWALESLESKARSSVGVAAADQAARVESAVLARRRTLDDFMAKTRLECGYPLEGGGMLWSLPCVTMRATDFHGNERPAGLQVIRGSRSILELGAPVSIDIPPAGSPEAPILLPASSGSPRYQLRGIDRGLVVVAEYGFDEVAASLAEGDAGPGTATQLLDRDGRVLAAAGSSTVSGSEAACTGDADGDAAGDPAGARTLRASRRVNLFGACVDVRLPLAPALAAAGELQATLWRLGAAWAAVAAVLAFLVSRWVTAPTRRLAAALPAIGRGEAEGGIVPSGPSELQALGVAMQSMSADVARRLTNLEMARREAEAASNAKDQFVAMLSRELRELVTTVHEWIHGAPPGKSAAGR